MRSISEIFKSYRETLDRTYKEQTRTWEEIKGKVESFYNNFLKDLIINYGGFISDYYKSSLIKESIREIFGTDKIKFVAIDGSSFKEEFSEFIVFYGGAYAVRGSLKLKENPVKIEYEKWDIKYDKSIVAYIPVPYLSLDIEESEVMFFPTDKDKAQHLSIHNQLMQLAEVYLAYTFVKNPDTDVNLILMDNSLSSMYLSNDVLHKRNYLKITGKKFRRNKLTEGDIYIAYAMPINEELDIPSCKNFHGEFYIIRKLFKKNQIDLSESCNFLKEGKHLENLKNLKIIDQRSTLSSICMDPNFGENIKGSWEFTKNLFEHICEELFVNRNIDVLKVEKEEGNYEWLTSDDIKFLISVGIRMLIEESWKKNVMIIGIAKDSASKYFFRNYLGVIYYLGIYNFVPPGVSASDRQILEVLPFIDNSLSSPWSTVEFDSVFMSLHLVKDENGRVHVEGIRGDIIVPQERLFLRSLAQFYINRSKGSPQTGNVIFIDRLVHPKYDKGNSLLKKSGVEVETARGDSINPLFYRDNKDKNRINEALIFIIDALTKNLFPNIIGYPDPLHKADWGAKSMNKKIRNLIKSSEIKFMSDPLKKTLRQKREEGYRSL